MSTYKDLNVYNDYFSAQVAFHNLKDAGYDVQIINENSGTVLPSMIVGGIKIRVAAPEYEAAKAFLEEETGIDMNEYAEGYSENNKKCPYCLSRNTKDKDAFKQSFLGKKLFEKLPQLFDKEEWHCFECGKDFKIEDSNY